MIYRLLFTLSLVGISVMSYSQTVVYPVMPGINLNPDFEVKINDGSGFKSVPVQDIVDVCFAHFEMNGSIDIEITVNEPVVKCKISPESLNITPTIQGNKISFTLTNASKIIVLVNDGAGNHNTGLDGLCILAEKPEINPPKLSDPNVVNVMKYCVDSTGATVNTQKIQRAFDDNRERNRIIYFPPGIYKSGMLHVRDKQSVYLAPGAVLLGSTDMNDYAQLPGEGASNEKYLLGSWNSNNIKIFGRGIVNGNGTALRTQDPTGSGFKTHNIQMQGGNNITLEGIISLDASSWSIEPIYCDSLTIKNVKVMSDLRIYENAKNNTDGMDINRCSHVWVEDCLIWSGDDAITPKQDNTYATVFPYQDIQNHTYRNIVAYTRKCAVKIGDETMNSSYQMHNMLFENFEVVLADRVCAIWSEDGALIRDITFKNFNIEEIYTQYQSHIHFRIAGNGNSIKNVDFINIKANEPAPKGSSFIGDNLGNTINGETVQYYNIHFNNYVIGGNKVLDINDSSAKFKLKSDTVSADSTQFTFE